jgi:hypothetical protein
MQGSVDERRLSVFLLIFLSESGETVVLIMVERVNAGLRQVSVEHAEAN